MTNTAYTVEIFKKDRRFKSGERLVLKKDHTDIDLKTLRHLYLTTYFIKDGYRHEFHETWITRKNMMSNEEYLERYDTPNSCSPSSETYWSM